ncbi:transcriptional regulatory protein [Actinoallomurus iriomotensis]|uniref:Transcriptional regulatory protein n=1 Tax=Actinoallomurus iriomotensis TaxID=478107 RepID=A0A9W6S0G1_9ACTN|nr:transcriptional regulatory protein [Actinoallomurus iriomotensis]
MIDVLVVDDDFRVAQVHAGFVELVPGFRVAGRARTAADARAKAAGADLVLLDVYLPDESGLNLLPDLAADVIMATAATDQESVRTAFSRGALHYLIKPFTAGELGERLRAYARYRERLANGGQLTQDDVDRAVRVLYDVPRGVPRAVKGQSPVTSRLVAEALRRADRPRSAAEISDEVGISRATAQRYLASLAQSGRALVTLRYGTTGRPEHEYVWRPGASFTT